MRNRTVGDLLILSITFTICASVLFAGLSASIYKFVHPEADIRAGIAIVADILNTLIGLLAGYIAGKSGGLVHEQDIQQPSTNNPRSPRPGKS